MSISSPHTSTSSEKPNGTPQTTMRTPKEITDAANPSRPLRLLIILSFPVLILLAVPFWWYTTSIERLALPTARIDALESLPPPVVRSTILLTSDEDAYPQPPAGKATYTAKEVCEGIGKKVTDGVDSIYAQGRTKGVRYWDMVYVENKRQPPALRIHLSSSTTANTSFPLEPYIQPRGAFSAVKEGTVVVPVHPSQVSDRFLREHYKIAIINSILDLYPSTPPEIPLRALKYSPNITLSFVLLNEDSTDGSYVRSWDVEAAIKGASSPSSHRAPLIAENFIPHLQPLAPVFNFTIESQVLYHAPLAFEPSFGAFTDSEDGRVARAIDAAKAGDEAAEEVAKALLEEEVEKAWLIDEEMMKVFVNSESWSLDSGSTNNPVLRFLLFVPSAKHRPMRLSLPNTAQSFLLPQFGAVSILNPPPSAPSSQTYHLDPSALAPSFHLFTSHLYALLALPPSPPKIHHPPSTIPGQPRSPLAPALSRWQLETIMRQRMVENSNEARKTLAGIVRLVSKIKEMQVGKGVRDMVIGAVERLEQLEKTKDPLHAFLLSRDAVTLANQAFFDPSMMGLLYFPNEHKFAVYTPLFAPIAVPIFAGLLKELIAWLKRHRARADSTDSTASPAPVAADSEDQPGTGSDRDGDEGAAAVPEKAVGHSLRSRRTAR